MAKFSPRERHLTIHLTIQSTSSVNPRPTHDVKLTRPLTHSLTHHSGPDNDVEIRRPVHPEKADASGVDAPRPPPLQAVDDFHGALLRGPGHGPPRKSSGDRVQSPAVGPQPPTDGRNQLFFCSQIGKRNGGASERTKGLDTGRHTPCVRCGACITRAEISLVERGGWATKDYVLQTAGEAGIVLFLTLPLSTGTHSVTPRHESGCCNKKTHPQRQRL